VCIALQEERERDIRTIREKWEILNKEHERQLTKRLLPLHRGALRSQDQQVLVRFGVSYVSAEQACQNAEDEIPTYDFEGVVAQSKMLWNEK
jgi:putative alpha-1,2-mannosidase